MGAAAVPVLVGATVLSTYMQVQALRANSEMMKRSAAAEAERAEIAAKNAAAAASVQQEQIQRKVDLTMSRARAVAAASGAQVPEDFFAKIAERGEEQKQLVGWESREAGRGLRDRGAMAQWNAAAQGRLSAVQQLATVVGGAAQLGGIAARYGGPAGGGGGGGGGGAWSAGMNSDPVGWGLS